MPTSQPPRSSYRERRISVMLQDQSPNTSSIPDLSSNAPKQPKRINHRVLIVSLLVALLCAGTVFFLLFRRDATQSTPIARAVAPATAIDTPSSALTAAAPVASPRPEQTVAEPPATAEPVGTPVESQRVRFQLKRSDRFQTFGPIKLRLLSTTPRRGLCSVAIANGTDHPRSRSLAMNRQVQLQGENGASVDLVINGMTKDVIRGSVAPHEPVSAQ